MNNTAKFFLDEGVPQSVGHALIENGHEVIFFREAAIPGSPDPIVAEVALQNLAILVAIDSDMKTIARKRGVSNNNYRRLSLLKLSCKETKAASRVIECLPFIELQLKVSNPSSKRQFFVEIGQDVLKIYK